MKTQHLRSPMWRSLWRSLWRSAWRPASVALIALSFGCGELEPKAALPERGSSAQGERAALGAKGDRAAAGFPEERDLALLFTLEDSVLRWTEHLPSEWLDEVSDALEASALGEDISLESWEEDWRLVSARVTPCQPLGLVADAEELDALCWPQLRLVWQPIVKDLNVTGLIRPYYADDRAIHTLFFASPEHPQLLSALGRVERGARWSEWSAEERMSFERARDREALALMEELSALRGSEGPYEGLEERPEVYSELLASTFFEGLSQLLKRRCRAEQLSELTAFSLPLGRSPAAADLWSFIAFSAERGELSQSPLTVRDARSGARLFSFPESEDVTTGHGDKELLEALPSLSEAEQTALLSQVITDTDELVTKGDRINDPYQTTVAHTTCASCHRANNINFNFHNLSYLEDQELSVSPRVKADVARDLSLAQRLWWTGTLQEAE